MGKRFKIAFLLGLVLISGIINANFALAENRITIHFWHAMGGALGETVQTMVNNFNTSQSRYEVKAVNKGAYAETMTAAIAAYRAKNNPHLVQVFEAGTQTMMMSGAVYPVYQLMKDNHIRMNWNSFVPPVLSYYAKDNHLYSMPFNSSTPVLYYNKTAFAKAGLDLNKPPATWKEVEEYSRKLIAAEASEYGFTVGWPSWTMVENMHAWHGLPFASKQNGFGGLDTELLINGQFGVMHIGKLAEWQKEKIFRYGGRQSTSDPIFFNGQSAMHIQSSAMIGSLTKAVKNFEWGTAQLPHWGKPYKKVNSIIGGASLWVLKGKKAEEYEGVAQFLKYLTQPSQQAFWHKATGYICISKDAQQLLDKEGYLDKNPNQRTAYSQLTFSKPIPETRGIRLGNFVQIRDIIEEEMENIFNGNKSAKTGLDDAVRRANQVLRDFEQFYK